HLVSLLISRTDRKERAVADVGLEQSQDTGRRNLDTRHLSREDPDRRILQGSVSRIGIRSPKSREIGRLDLVHRRIDRAAWNGVPILGKSRRNACFSWSWRSRSARTMAPRGGIGLGIISTGSRCDAPALSRNATHREPR